MTLLKAWSVQNDKSTQWTCAVIVGIFSILSFPWALTPIFVFDELYYIPAARALLDGEAVLNREHPMHGKVLIAASMRIFGDTPLGWRSVSLVSMPLAIWFATRAMWALSEDRRATVAFAILLASSCLLFVLGRVGTLDAPMLMFTALGVLCIAHDYRNLAAVAFGLSLACKWTIAPLLPLLALALGRGGGARTLTMELARFGFIPLAVYVATFAPGFFVRDHPLVFAELGHLHLTMWQTVSEYDRPSPYASRWWHWLLNLSPFWATAHPIGEAWRFVILVVNPISAYFIVPALLLSWWDRRAVWPAIFFVAQIAVAAVAGRIQFVHQYALPMMTGFAVVALILSRLKGIWSSMALALSVAGFFYMYPVLTGAPLSSRSVGERYQVLPSWGFVDLRSWASTHLRDSEDFRATRQECMEEPADCLR